MSLSPNVTIRRCNDCCAVSHNEVGSGIRGRACLDCGSKNTTTIRTNVAQVSARYAPLYVAMRLEEGGPVVVCLRTGIHG